MRKTTKKNSNNKRRSSYRGSVEPLEARQLLASDLVRFEVPNPTAGESPLHAFDFNALDFVQGNFLGEDQSSVLAKIIGDPAARDSNGNITTDSLAELYQQSGVEDYLVPTYYQARLNSFTKDGLPVAAPNLAGYEVTAIIVATTFFDEVTLDENRNLQTASSTIFKENGDIGELRMFYDGSQNANDLLGTGFDDGQLFLTAEVLEFQNIFEIELDEVGPLQEFFDQINNDDFGGQRSVVSEGGTAIELLVESVDERFLPSGPIDGKIDLVFANTSNITPFRQGAQPVSRMYHAGLFHGISLSL